jgi:protoheme IX farnesyltransferase
MNTPMQSLTQTQPLEKSWFAVLGDLVKLRLTSLVLFTTGIGFYAGTVGPVDFGLLFHTLLGTALVAGGASALNQFWERDLDAKMRRTEARPLPSGRLRPATALGMGLASSVLGLAYLGLAVNGLTCLLGAVTLATYLLIYTPLKTITPLNTVIGAIPGALPPLMGWTAVRGELSSAGWSLFAILFFWQLPHFLAIAWLYREDYARAGFVMLPALDPRGERTGRLAVGHVLGLLAVSLAPVVFGLAGAVYLAGALILGGLFLAAAWQFSRGLSSDQARRLFYVSLVYLPAVLVLLALDKVGF